MKTFLFLLKGKRRGQQTEQLLLGHVEHLKTLWKSGNLVLCGPFEDNDGAVQVIRAKTEEEARKLFVADPFIREQYYTEYVVYEMAEANPENRWLMDSPQTKGNLKS